MVTWLSKIERKIGLNYFWDQEVPVVEPFSFWHLIYIGAAVIIFILLLRNRNKIKRHADTFRKGIAIVSIAQQILLYSWYYFETSFDLSIALPFHLSRITSILGIIYLLTKNEKVLNVQFYWSVFAYGSFLYPANIHPPFHALGISYFVNHVITIMLPAFAIISYDWYPKKEGIKSAYGWFLAYMIAIYFFNPLVDGNYFYMEDRVAFQNMPDFWYILFVAIFTLTLFTLYYYVYTAILKKNTYTKQEE